jgi:16S rRNA (adenine1518-N6/adenine1519-N6)-dimethyltransferase
VVVEIGPGQGALTDLLAAKASRVVAIEIDRDLAARLRDRYRDRPGVEVVQADALEADWSALAGGPYLLAGNLPYYITTPLLFRSLEPPAPERAVFLVQREVADRITAAPGSRTYGALSVNVQVSRNCEVVATVPAGAFHPRPSVDSAIIRLTPLPGNGDAGVEPGFRGFVQGIFGFRRKQMVRVLRELGRGAVSPQQAGALLDAAGIHPSARPETLAPAEFVALHRRWRGSGVAA